VRVDRAGKPAYARCLQLEEELRDLRQRLAASGQYVAYSPGPNPYANAEDELRRWLATEPGADAADGVSSRVDAISQSDWSAAPGLGSAMAPRPTR
jgi:hypothetical protein